MGLQEMKDEFNKEEEEELSLEDLLKQVEECITVLENPEISLEDSFRCYELGVQKLHQCKKKVSQIEQKMLILNAEYLDEEDSDMEDGR